MSTASDLFREVLALGDRVRGLCQRVDNLGARVDGSMSVQDLREEIATMKRESKLQYEREGPNANVSFFTGNIRRLEKELAAALSRKDAVEKKPEGGKYNASAVQKEIEKDKRIKPGEAKAIHGLLKGWRKDDADCGTKADAGEITKASVQNMEKAKLMAALNSSWATPAEKKIIERELDDRANRGL